MITKEDILTKIPDIFWENLRYELCSIFGMSLVENDDYFMNISESIGLSTALKNACNNSNCLWVLEDISKLPWFDYDVIDDFILDQLKVRNFIKIYSQYDLAQQTIYQEISFCEFCNKPFPSKDLERIYLEPSIPCSVCHKCAREFRKEKDKHED